MCAATATATRRKTRSRKKAESLAEHFATVSTESDGSRVELVIAQDAAGKYYGDFAIAWKRGLSLQPRTSQLCPSTAKKFGDSEAARQFAGSEAVRHLERMHMDAGVGDVEWHAIAVLRQKLVDEDEMYARMLDARKTQRHELDAMDEWIAETELIQPIPVDKIHPHPANRHVSDESCRDLAESMQARGLQQPIKVRQPGEPWELPEGHYQIVFGERRWRAARLAGHDTIPAVIAELSDAQALELIATENGQRLELNDIERGDLLERLAAPIDQGGAGKTPAEAAAVLGIARSTAANLRRVAALPEWWRQLVVSQEMDGSRLRAVASYRDCPDVLKLLREEYEKDRKAKWTFVENWGSKEVAEDSVRNVVEYDTKPLTADDVLQDERLESWEKPAFAASTLTDGQRKKLRIVDVPKGDGHTTVRRCLNKQAWRELNKAAAKASAGGKKSDGKAAKQPSSPPTAAEVKARAKRAADATRKGVRLWRLKWLRMHSAAKLEVTSRSTAELMLWLLAWHGWQLPQSARSEAVRLGLLAQGLRTPPRDEGTLWKAMRKLPDGKQLPAVRDVLRALLYPEALDPGAGCNAENLPDDVVYGVAEELGITTEGTWRDAQQGTLRPPLWVAFFELHTKEQLQQLAKELKVPVEGAGTKSQMVKRFATQPRVLPMPKCLEGKK